MTNGISFSISYKKFREPKKIKISTGFHVVYGESGVGKTQFVKSLAGFEIQDSTIEWELIRPFDPPEVWAAGVTYKNSEMERRRESDTPDIYTKVYNADRPEVFFKSTSTSF